MDRWGDHRQRTGGFGAIEAVSILHGAVELKYLNNGFPRVEVECLRGMETEFKFLVRDTESPYVATGVSLTDAPETRHYRARYLQITPRPITRTCWW